MRRLTAVVEGQTEEQILRGLLADHLGGRGVDLSVTIVGKHRRGARGGGHYGSWRTDLQRLLGGDRERYVTSFFDLYGLPHDFPGLGTEEPDTCRRCDALERAMADDIDDRRFIPYIQRHEAEALVLAALPSLRRCLDPSQHEGLEALAQELGETPPEDVNDGRETAPSKRILRHVHGYGKTVHGPLAVEDAGLSAVRARCPRFDAWVTRLEALGA